MRASALASIFTSALLASLAGAGGVPASPASVATAELEASLARKPDIYLVLRAPERLLEVRARGVVLDTIHLAGIEVVAQQPALHHSLPERLEVPRVLTISHGPGDSAREVIAPPELRPAPKDDEEGAADSPESAPSATPTPVPEAPTSYRAVLDNGWDLWICEALPSQTFTGRLRAAVRDGWRRAFGHVPTEAPALTLAMTADDAQRIFHLIGTSRAILVTGDQR